MATATKTASANKTDVLAEARAVFANCDHFASMSPQDQENRVFSRACALAIFRSPIGKAASAVYDAMGNLADALDAFLSQFPDDETANAATAAALLAAGLASSKTNWAFHNETAFASTPENLRGWQYQVSLMLSLEENLARPAKMEGGDDE